MQAEGFSETSFWISLPTWHHILNDSQLCNSCYDNLKSKLSSLFKFLLFPHLQKEVLFSQFLFKKRADVLYHCQLPEKVCIQQITQLYLCIVFAYIPIQSICTLLREQQ